MRPALSFTREFLAGRGVENGLQILPGAGMPAPLDAMRNISGALGERCLMCSGYGQVISGIRDGARGGCMGSAGTCHACRGTGVHVDVAGMQRLLHELSSTSTLHQREIADLRRRLAERPTLVNSRQFWRETIWYATANGTTIASSTTETILMPNVTIPANYMQDGRALQIVCMGKVGATATPTMTFRLRWGGVAGTVLAATSAITLAAATDVMFRIELEVVTRANGSSGSLLAMGLVNWGVTIKTTNTPDSMGSAGGASTNTPAAVTVDLTTDNALSLTATWGTSSASNTITGMQYLGDSLN